MSWDQIIEDTKIYNEQRAILLSEANVIRDRYRAFMKSMERHLSFPGYLDVNVQTLKFVPEKSSIDKGFLFATSKTKLLVPGEYVVNPDEWEERFKEEIDERIAMIRNNSSHEFFMNLGENFRTQETTETRLGLTIIQFKASTDRRMDTSYNRPLRRTNWYYMNKATGKIYLNTNGTYSLYHEIANGTATPIEF